MTELLLLTVIGVGVALTFVVPVLSLARSTRAVNTVAMLQRDLEAIRRQIDDLRRDLAALEGAGHPDRMASSEPAAATAPPALEPEQAVSVPGEAPSLPPPPGPPPTSAPATATAPAAAHHATLEERIGARWLLYVALGSLLLGTSYFVKYAFDNEWITPAMRVGLGAVAGLVLAWSGRRFDRRGLAFFGGMLAGGGISILYVSVYAAFNFYALIEPGLAFALMVGITGLGAVLADVHASQALALLSVVGGFLTPFLVSTGRDAQVALFTYDAVLVAGTMYLARRRDWPLLNLASFALTGMTLVAWAITYYRPSKWTTTELFITLFCAMFIHIQRHTWRAGTPLARGVGTLLVLAPLSYHAASLGILAPHPLWLLVYLIAVTATAVIAAGHWRSAWLRLAVLVLVGTPMFAWIWRYHSATWLVPGTVAIVAIYAIHLLASFREVGAHADRLSAPEILVLHGNGAWLYGALSGLLETELPDWMGTLAAAIAAWNIAIALVQRSRALEAWVHHLALGFALAAVAVAVQYDGAWVTVGWAAEGAALLYIGLALRRDWLRVGGAVLLGIAVARLVDALGLPAATGALPLFNARGLSAAFVILLLALLAAVHRKRSPDGARLERATLILVAHLLTVLLISSEINAAFQMRAWVGTATGGGAGAATTAELARQVSLSTTWAAYAFCLVAAGFKRRYAPIRYLAIAVFAFTVGKVFFVDLSRLDRIWRILSVIALGLLLLGASYLYQRFAVRTAEPARDDARLA